MDEHYDVNDAGVRLEEWTNNRGMKNRHSKQLCNFLDVDGIKDNCKIIGAGTGAKGCWKLCAAQNTEGSELEEVVLRVQGIICKCDLPPIRKPFRVEPHRRTYMRQSVMLSGLSSPRFNDAMASTHTIEDMFRQVIPTGTMDDWAPSSFQGYTTIDISNRYFTPAHLASQDDEQVPFSTSVDPDRILSVAMGNEFIHTEDNEVEYYEAQRNAKGTKHFEIEPDSIRVGDVVEAQLSFEAIRMKGNRQKMIIKLRAITLLDKGARINASIAKAKSWANVPQTNVLKCKIGYEGESEDEDIEMPDISRVKV